MLKNARNHPSWPKKKLLKIAQKLVQIAQNCSILLKSCSNWLKIAVLNLAGDFFPPALVFFFLICSVFRPLHLSCHVPSMLHAICSILELEPFILHVLCSLWELEPSMLHAICSILELELSILHAICRIWAQEPSIHLSCYLPHLRAGTFQFACYL